MKAFEPATGGPIVIVGRPRSGSRVLAQLLLTNGVFMGADLHERSLDSFSWHQRFVVPIVTSRKLAAHDDCAVDPDCAAFGMERAADTLPRYRNGIWPEGPWGWKFCETLFVMPLVKALFPRARFVHLIRDARDVCLSNRGFFQLTGDLRDPPGWSPASNECGAPSFRNFCTAVTFGRRAVTHWRGLDLQTHAPLIDNRFLIQAQSWLTCVARARAYGQRFPEDYFELRYEDLCRAPLQEARRLFEWLRLPVRPAIEQWAATVHGMRVRRWQGVALSMRETRDFARAIDLAAPLLRELEYAA